MGESAVNLAPADLPKSTGRYDLAVRFSSRSIESRSHPSASAVVRFLGELSLTGGLREVRGILPHGPS
ncbi:MAG: magnesium chelatase domain-containing protein [Candidatus Azotimanducaceae bacterium WSBS_2022_MAG_OTU7]